MTYSEAWAKLAFRCRKQSGRSTTTSGKSSSRTERGTRLSRIPFHKRQLHDYIPSNTINPSATVSTSTSCSTSVNITGQSTTSGAATICTSSPGTPQSTHTTATTNNKSVTVASVTTGSQRFVINSKRNNNKIRWSHCKISRILFKFLMWKFIFFFIFFLFFFVQILL